jgi:hypothetical protein
MEAVNVRAAMFRTPEDIRADQDKQRDTEEKRKEALELLFVCVQDIVDAWPKITMRTLGQMTTRIETLKQALEEARK